VLLLLVGAVPVARAQEQGAHAPHVLDIPGGPLAQALAELSRQTGTSIGFKGAPPDVFSPHVKGRMTVEQALDHLLAGSGLRAVASGPAAYRLERVPPAPAAPPRPEPAQDLPRILPKEEIVITGMKRAMPLATAPQSVSVLTLDSASGLAPLPDTEEVAARTVGLTLTRLGPGRNRMFIRGVADSAFLGNSQSTVSVYLDESRLTYAAPDPDLLLADVERVEVLKGPQGPLYGTGALGGVYRMVTNRPVLDDVSAATTIFGIAALKDGVGGGGSAMLNIPIVRDRLGIRLVGYDTYEPGWVQVSRGRNDTHIRGGRLSLRWAPTPEWTVDLNAAAQRVHADDNQYISVDRIIPSASQREGFENTFKMASATVSRSLGDLRLLSNTSWVHQLIDSNYREAEPDDAPDPGEGDMYYFERRRYNLLSQEIRLASDTEAPVSWVTGVSVLSATTDARVTETWVGESSIEPTHTFGNHTPVETTEAAIFGEATWRLGAEVDVNVGGRLFHSWTRGKQEDGEGAPPIPDRSRWAVSPSLSLSWRPAEGRFYYVRYANAFRPATLGQTGSEQAAALPEDDKLSTVDAGTRLTAAGGHLALDGSVYLTFWQDMQSDYLLENGLVTTRNIGNSRIYGIESTLTWKPTESWTLELGATLQHARLVQVNGDGSAIEGSRLPLVPDGRVRLALTRRFQIDGWTLDLRGSAERVGPTQLSFQPELDRYSGSYAVYGLSASLEHGPWAATLLMDNVLDYRGNVFPYGNPFTVYNSLQTASVHPQTVKLSISRRW